MAGEGAGTRKVSWSTAPNSRRTHNESPSIPLPFESTRQLLTAHGTDPRSLGTTIMAAAVVKAPVTDCRHASRGFTSTSLLRRPPINPNPIFLMLFRCGTKRSPLPSPISWNEA